MTRLTRRSSIRLPVVITPSSRVMPAPFAMIVRSDAPCSWSAAMRLWGVPGSPKPATRMREPSSTPATASSKLPTTLERIA